MLCARVHRFINLIFSFSGVMDTEYCVTKALQSFRTGKSLGYRSEWSSDVFFGQNLDHEGHSGGCVAVGDEVFKLM